MDQIDQSRQHMKKLLETMSADQIHVVRQIEESVLFFFLCGAVSLDVRTMAFIR